jgi:hypothetical protein
MAKQDKDVPYWQWVDIDEGDCLYVGFHLDREDGGQDVAYLGQVLTSDRADAADITILVTSDWQTILLDKAIEAKRLEDMDEDRNGGYRLAA